MVGGFGGERVSWALNRGSVFGIWMFHLNIHTQTCTCQYSLHVASILTFELIYDIHYTTFGNTAQSGFSKKDELWVPYEHLSLHLSG